MKNGPGPSSSGPSSWSISALSQARTARSSPRRRARSPRGGPPLPDLDWHGRPGDLAGAHLPLCGNAHQANCRCLGANAVRCWFSRARRRGLVFGRTCIRRCALRAGKRRLPPRRRDPTRVYVRGQERIPAAALERSAERDAPLRDPRGRSRRTERHLHALDRLEHLGEGALLARRAARAYRGPKRRWPYRLHRSLPSVRNA
jgi:hypothetical protein